MTITGTEFVIDPLIFIVDGWYFSNIFGRRISVEELLVFFYFRLARKRSQMNMDLLYFLSSGILSSVEEK